MNDSVPGWEIILQGLRYFSESFFENWVVLKNWALTKTLLLTLKLGVEECCTLVDFW